MSKNFMQKDQILQKGIERIIDIKYASIPAHIKQKIKVKTLNLIEQKNRERSHENLTLHVFDKNAPSQTVRFLSMEPFFI